MSFETSIPYDNLYGGSKRPNRAASSMVSLRSLNTFQNPTFPATIPVSSEATSCCGIYHPLHYATHDLLHVSQAAVSPMQVQCGTNQPARAVYEMKMCLVDFNRQKEIFILRPRRLP